MITLNILLIRYLRVHQDTRVNLQTADRFKDHIPHVSLSNSRSRIVCAVIIKYDVYSLLQRIVKESRCRGYETMRRFAI